MLGFAIADGTPPFRTTEVQRIEPLSDAVERNIDIAPDVLQNYFAIFVEGRTYSGVTYAGIDIDANKVAGSLSGRDPIGIQAFTAADATAAASGVNNSLPIVNRGLSGGFTAKIKKKQAVFTFKGDGQLSTAANPQTVSMTTVSIEDNPIAPPLVPRRNRHQPNIDGFSYHSINSF